MRNDELAAIAAIDEEVGSEEEPRDQPAVLGDRLPRRRDIWLAIFAAFV